MPAKTKRPATVPENASHFVLERHWFDEQRKKQRRTKVKGHPLPDGTVPDTFAASDFDPAKILATFGPGTYRVDFYDAAGAHIGGSGAVFDVADPDAGDEHASVGKKKKKTRPAADEGAAAAAPAAATLLQRAASGQFGLLDFLALQEQQRRDAEERAERQAARDRADQEARMERDRQFMAQMIQMMNRAPASAGVDMDLLRREMALAAKETQLTLRQQLAAFAQEIQQPGDDEPDDDKRDDPQDVEEGIQRIGGRLLAELEAKSPQLVGGALEWLGRQGFAPSPELQREIAAAAAVRVGANGANGR